MKSSEILNSAANLIDQNGLAKGMLYDGGMDSYCANGAINQVTRGHWAYPEIDPEGYIEAVRALNAALPVEWQRTSNLFAGIPRFVPTCNIAEWNNADERLPSEVTDLMRQTAKTLEVEGK